MLLRRLEVEIEEARLKAKEEMMQGIQMAKELAMKELLDQKTLYENKINALENELVCLQVFLPLLTSRITQTRNIAHKKHHGTQLSFRAPLYKTI